jgi:hypothetical protein
MNNNRCVTNPPPLPRASPRSAPVGEDTDVGENVPIAAAYSSSPVEYRRASSASDESVMIRIIPNEHRPQQNNQNP